MRSSSGNYEGGIRDIMILAGRGKQSGETLTSKERLALWSELSKLMRNSLISRPGALYGASISAQTVEKVTQAILNLTDSDGVGDLNVVKSVGDFKCAHIKGYVGDI